MNTGCLISKGKRRDAEEHFSSLSDLYPTKNVEDLFEKFPEGGTLIYSTLTKEGNDDYNYYYTFKVDSKNQTIIGTENKSIYKEKFIDLYKVPVEYKNGEKIYLENPELENHKITFLFENLSYVELKKYEYKRSSYGFDSDMYTLSYYVPIELAKQYMDIKEECEPYISISATSNRFPEVELASMKCSETIRETFKIGE